MVCDLLCVCIGGGEGEPLKTEIQTVFSLYGKPLAAPLRHKINRPAVVDPRSLNFPEKQPKKTLFEKSAFS